MSYAYIHLFAFLVVGSVMDGDVVCLDMKHHSFVDSWEEEQRDLLAIMILPGLMP